MFYLLLCPKALFFATLLFSNLFFSIATFAESAVVLRSNEAGEVKFSPNERYLAIAGGYHKLTLHDLENPENKSITMAELVMKGDEKQIGRLALSWSPDSRYLVATTYREYWNSAQQMLLWDVEELWGQDTPQPISRVILPVQTTWNTFTPTFSSDGNQIFNVNEEEKTLEIFSVAELKKENIEFKSIKIPKFDLLGPQCDKCGNTFGYEITANGKYLVITDSWRRDHFLVSGVRTKISRRKRFHLFDLQAKGEIVSLGESTLYSSPEHLLDKGFSPFMLNGSDISKSVYLSRANGLMRVDFNSHVKALGKGRKKGKYCSQALLSSESGLLVCKQENRDGSHNLTNSYYAFDVSGKAEKMDLGIVDPDTSQLFVRSYLNGISPSGKYVVIIKGDTLVYRIE